MRSNTGRSAPGFKYGATGCSSCFEDHRERRRLRRCTHDRVARFRWRFPDERMFRGQAAAFTHRRTDSRATARSRRLISTGLPGGCSSGASDRRSVRPVGDGGQDDGAGRLFPRPGGCSSEAGAYAAPVRSGRDYLGWRASNCGAGEGNGPDGACADVAFNVV